MGDWSASRTLEHLVRNVWRDACLVGDAPRGILGPQATFDDARLLLIVESECLAEWRQTPQRVVLTNR